MKTVAIIQARMGSNRLPGKVLMDIAGKTMLEHVVNRVSESRLVDQTVIATSNQLANQPIWNLCQRRRWAITMGDEHDVLSRFWNAAQFYQAQQIVRITSDCPLIDPGIIDLAISTLSHNKQLDYVCNFHPNRSFPRGLDVEAFTMDALSRVVRSADSDRLREHVTLAIYENANRFQIGCIRNPTDMSHLRWTVDTSQDLTLIKQIHNHFGEQKFNWRDVIQAYTTHPHWRQINRNVLQKSA